MTRISNSRAAVNNLIIGAKHGTQVIRKYKELMESYVFSKPFQYIHKNMKFPIILTIFFWQELFLPKTYGI